MHVNFSVTKRFVILFFTTGLLLGTVSCRTIYSWDRGYPLDGSELSQTERELSFKKYTLLEIDEKSVIVLANSGGEQVKKEYSRESFEPIFKHITPGALEELKAGDSIAANDILIGSLSTAIVTSAIPQEPVLKAARDVTLIGGFLIALYVNHLAQKHYETALSIYQTELRQYLKISDGGL